MKHLTAQPVTAVALMFGMITVTAVMLWPMFRPEIQTALRSAQDIIFWWV